MTNKKQKKKHKPLKTHILKYKNSKYKKNKNKFFYYIKKN